MKLPKFIPVTTVYAHCDLPCGIYDPAQARIEAASIYAITKKAADSSDESFKIRATMIKEERAELVKHHLWVLWADYFKPEHVEKFPDLHETFWKATKAAGETKHHSDIQTAKALLDAVDAVGELFAKTKEGYDYAAVVKNTNAQIGL
jgi:nickel superoxide dismutase